MTVASGEKMVNAMTVDVEDWFQVSVLRQAIDYKDWHAQESRIVPNVNRILALFEEHNIKATFFVLGWIAEKYPDLVVSIRKHGHEIGSHGYAHQIIYEHPRKEFVEDLDKSIAILEGISGEKIIYYRAPSFSITRKTMWALEDLADRGIQYDSSIFPIKHDIGGMPHMPRDPFYLILQNGQRLNEFPLSTLKLWGENLPVSGGGYLRLLPYWFIKTGIARNNKDGIPVILYFHPWELDPKQPRVELKWPSRFRHYTNLEFMEERVKGLLTDFKFTSIGQLAKEHEITRRWPDIANTNGG